MRIIDYIWFTLLESIGIKREMIQALLHSKSLTAESRSQVFSKFPSRKKSHVKCGSNDYKAKQSLLVHKLLALVSNNAY